MFYLVCKHFSVCEKSVRKTLWKEEMMMRRWWWWWCLVGGNAAMLSLTYSFVMFRTLSRWMCVCVFMKSIERLF